MKLIDTHAHLYLDDFENDRTKVLDRARENGIDKIILPNIDVESIEKLHQLTESMPDLCVPLMGLHPTYVKEDYREQLKIMKRNLETFNYKGIGEIGIDLYWDKTYVKQQEHALELQLEMALDLKLPVVIHARDSFREILNIVGQNKYSEISGIFHAFTGDEDLAAEIIDLGFFLGIGGILTFKNSPLSKVIANINLKHLVLETDSPYLTPTPFRGKRNESAYIAFIAEHLADIKKLNVQEVADVTTYNAKRIFNL